MNYCTKCASLYAQPGTCNCYATVAKPVQPIAPYIPWVPYTPPSPNTWPPVPPLTPVITYGGAGLLNGPSITSTTVRSDSPWFKHVTYTALGSPCS